VFIGSTPHGCIAAATVRALQAYLAGRSTGPIFLNRNGGRLGEPTVWRQIRRLARTAGVPRSERN
jgi:integrase/recombinase XerD